MLNTELIYRAHLSSDILLVEMTYGTYTVCGPLSNVHGLGGIITQAVTSVCGSQESLDGAQ